MSAESARTVIITGGSRGLGAGIVAAYLEHGDRVATCARSATPETDAWGADPELAGRFMFAPVDLSQRDQVDAFVHSVVDEWGSVDVLINNAGVAKDGVIAMFTDEDIDTVVDLNLKGTLMMTRAVVRRMLAKANGGKIVNISSIVGLSGYRGLAAYSATKASLDALTRSLARELGSRQITVNSIAPGYLRTEMSHGLDEAQLQQIVRRTPAGRLGEPGDVARAALFLTDPANDYITGHTLVIDGGLTG